MAKVYRVYVEKRKENAVEADSIKHDLMTRLGLTDVSNLTVSTVMIFRVLLKKY